MIIPKKIYYLKETNIQPKLVHISTEIILIFLNMLVYYVFSIDGHSWVVIQIFALCRLIQMPAKLGSLGRGELGHYWQCQD